MEADILETAHGKAVILVVARIVAQGFDVARIDVHVVGVVSSPRRRGPKVRVAALVPERDSHSLTAKPPRQTGKPDNHGRHERQQASERALARAPDKRWENDHLKSSLRLGRPERAQVTYHAWGKPRQQVNRRILNLRLSAVVTGCHQ